MKKKKQMTVSELETMLQSGEGGSIEILPDGTVRKKKGKKVVSKPVTFKQDLGNEYGSMIHRGV